MNKLLFVFLISWSSFSVLAQQVAVASKNWQPPEMVYVHGGTFAMGSELGDVDEDEKPVHHITLNNFCIGKYEVTVKQYREFCDATGQQMPEIPPWGWNDDHPVVNVTWYDAVGYCRWVSQKTGKNYHLPTEAQWEFAAKGASKSKDYIYSGGADLDEVGWFAGNAGMEGPRSVGTKKSNELGIFDMSGNVAEWCQDFYHEAYYSMSPAFDPEGPNMGTHRVVRGGSWKEEARRCRSTFRYINTEIIWYNFMGFRLAMEEN
jgi:sulfatase modifying factor 1